MNAQSLSHPGEFALIPIAPSRFRLRSILILPLAVLVLSVLCQSARAQTGPTITQQPVSQTVLPGSSVTLSVGVTGTGQPTYQWQFNGTNLPNEYFTTVAGNGPSGNDPSQPGLGSYSGDGGPATNASLNKPFCAAVDGAGNIFIADSDNARIRKVDVHGIITTVAGNGRFEYSGDGGAATNASLRSPSAVAVDATGNLFITDTRSSVIRKVDVNGIITTVAGNGSSGYSGDGGAATNARLNMNNLVGIAADASGNLFIADANNNVIRMVDTNGIITTVAGTGFVAGGGGGGGGYSGDGGPAISADLSSPSGVAVDGSGNLFIADKNNNVIRKVDTNGVITSVAGTLTEGNTGSPWYVAVDAPGNLFFTEQGSSSVYAVDGNGFLTILSSRSSSISTAASLDNPGGLAVDGSGNLFIADTYNNVIRKISPAGELPVLVLNNLSPSNAGNYSVIVDGSVTSAVATINVVASFPPAITQQPQNQTVLVGAPATLSVTATGAPPVDFQWYAGASGDTSSPVAGATNAVFTTPALYSSSGFWASVRNAYGTVSSAAGFVTVQTDTNPILGVSVIAGLPFLSITGEVGTSYRIQYATDLSAKNWIPLLSVTLPYSPFTLTDSAATNAVRFYRAVTP